MAPTRSPSRFPVATLVAAVGLVLSAVPDAGPLGFVPPLVRWPLGVAALAVLAFRPLTDAARSRRALEIAGLVLLAFAFLLLKSIGLHPSRADDGTYFYMAARLAEGLVPYRDFFFAHPPLHLVFPAAVFRVLGFSVVLGKLIPVTAQLAAASLLYFAVRPVSRRMAFFAALFHLFAYQVLMGSTDMNGENLMSALLAGGLLLAARGRPAAAGAFAGLALGTGLYALAGALSLGVAATFGGRRPVARFAVGLGASTAAWFVPFALLGGDGFFEGVFTYHLAKGGGDRRSMFAAGSPWEMVSLWLTNLRAYLGGRGFETSLYFHRVHYLAAALGLVLLARGATRRLRGARRGQRLRALAELLTLRTGEGLALFGLLGFTLFVLQWAGLGEVYDFYAVPSFVFLALPAAYVTETVVGALVDQSPGTRPGRPSHRPLVVGLSLLAVLWLQVPVGQRIMASMWPSETRQTGKVVKYDWLDPWVPAPVAGAAKALFFASSRERGVVEPPWRHYVWNKSLGLSTVRELAEHVRDHSAPDETLTGAANLAPLVALLADRRMAAEEIDTNNKRFRLGLLDDDVFLERICADRVRFVLAAPRSRFTERRMSADPELRRAFQVDRVFVDDHVRHFRPERFVLYRRVEGGAPCGPAPR